MMAQSFNLLSRRGFLQATTLATGVAFNPRIASTAIDVNGSAANVPMRAITQGPMAHWFGYYDKFQFDPTNRFVLGMEVGFEDRAPKSEDTIRIGMVDLEEGDRWIEIGATSAWCWQQGCMLQWLPGSDSQVIFNTRLKDKYGSVIVDVKTGAQRVLPGGAKSRWALHLLSRWGMDLHRYLSREGQLPPPLPGPPLEWHNHRTRKIFSTQRGPRKAEPLRPTPPLEPRWHATLH